MADLQEVIVFEGVALVDDEYPFGFRDALGDALEEVGFHVGHGLIGVANEDDEIGIHQVSGEIVFADGRGFVESRRVDKEAICERGFLCQLDEDGVKEMFFEAFSSEF